MKKLVFLLLCYFIGIIANAQVTPENHSDHDEHEEHEGHDEHDEVIHGNVYVLNEKGKRVGLEFASIWWKGTKHGTFSNEKGHFHIDHDETTDTLLVYYVGYFPDTTIVTEEMHEVNIVLQQAGELLGVTISAELEATRLHLKDAMLSQTMDEKELCKAACCSLSESFETNASIDASFTDAVTGTRQIKMLGLDGRYTQIMFDNIPTVRGLASIYGLSYLPGPWIREIAISKGVGSVVNGHESITGQINVAHKNNTMKEKAFINAYLGTQGRIELNGVFKKKVSERWNSTLLLHGAQSTLRFDMNNDGFLDNPLFQNLVLRNEWQYTGKGGLRGEYAATYHRLQNTSGQFDYDPKDEIRKQLWGVNTTTDRGEFTAKTGYVFEEKDGMSLGSQVSGSYHKQTGNYGNREYNGEQSNARVNLLFASEYNESVKQTSGVSFVHDDYNERLDSMNFDRTEQTFGLFSEHTFTIKEKASIIAGIRGDYHNTYGFFVTPRLHMRYSFNEKSSLKASIGKGYRSPNLLMDNVGLFASNRQINIETSQMGAPYGMKMEESVNIGIVYNQKFKLFHRDASIAMDVYRTEFQKQIVVDWETPTEINFYQLDGSSYSNSAQVEMQVSPIRRFNARLAYRWLEAKTQYQTALLDRPLIAQHRAFANLEYSTKEKDNGAKWMFDFTAKWLGKQRLPDTSTNPEGLQLASMSNDFWIFNAQISRHFNKKFELYVGGENLSNYRQSNPIVSADNPNSTYFDASLIYGPVFGSMGYVGLRWRIGAEE